MAIAGSQLIYDFLAQPTETPFVDGAWANIESTFENTNGTGLRPSSFVVTSMKLTAPATSTLIKSKLTISTNQSAAFDAVAPVIFDNTTGYGYLFICDGVTGRIRRRDATGTTGSTLGESFTITAAVDDVYELWYDKATGLLSAVVNDVVVSTQTDTTYQLSTLAVGVLGDPQNSNGRRIGTFGADYLISVGATIDSYPATVRSGDTGVTFTTTGLTAISSITLGSLAAIGISETSGDGTHSVPNLTDENVHGLYGTRTVTINGAGGSPTTTTNFQPLSSQSYITLSGTLNTSINGILYNFSPAAVAGDQMVWDTAKGTCDAQGNYETSHDGIQYLWHIQGSTGTARMVVLITGVPANRSILRRFPGIKDLPVSAFIKKYPGDLGPLISDDFFEQQTITGAFSGTTESVSSSITGTVETGGGITGSFAGTLDSVSSSISGNVRNTGSFSGTLSSVSSSISGNVRNTGSFSGTLSGVSSSISGNVRNTGVFSGGTESVSSLISGSIRNAGSFSGSTAPVSSIITGNVVQIGSFTGTLESVSSSITGTVATPMVTGSFAGTLQSVSSLITGNVRQTGIFAGTTESVSSSISGSVRNTGSFASQTDSVSSSISVQVRNPGSCAGTFEGVSSSISSTIINYGQFSGSTDSVSSSILGQVGLIVPTIFFPSVIVKTNQDYLVSLDYDFRAKIDADFRVEVTYGV